MTALFDIIACLFLLVLGLSVVSTLCIPLSAYNGVDVEYYKRHNRFAGLKSR